MNEKSLKKGAVFLLVFVLGLSFVSAGFFDWFNEMTGQATEQPVDINISVGSGSAPVIYTVYNISAVTLNLGPSDTNVTINFSVSDSDGIANLNSSTASMRITKSGTTRSNTSCQQIAASGNNANYSCEVTLYWYDVDGVDWMLNATISDINGNSDENSTATLTIDTLDGFVSGPGALSFTGVNPGSTNVTATTPLLLNNTGNQVVSIGNIQINATDLVGEQESSKALYSGNFSVGPVTGSNAECAATFMNDSGLYANVATANLTIGDYVSNNNNVTGQEQLFFCLTLAGSELTSQPYSTADQGSWTVKIA